jgi:predicted  nucleic acid-binding Zn-ribbon protein
VNTWKLDRGCADCGYNKIPEALEFDHTADDKVRAVAFLLTQNVPFEQVVDEMEKCDVVCANCHRERTVARKHAVEP